MLNSLFFMYERIDEFIDLYNEKKHTKKGQRNKSLTFFCIVFV